MIKKILLLVLKHSFKIMDKNIYGSVMYVLINGMQVLKNGRKGRNVHIVLEKLFGKDIMI